MFGRFSRERSLPVPSGNRCPLGVGGCRQHPLGTLRPRPRLSQAESGPHGPRRRPQHRPAAGRAWLRRRHLGFGSLLLVDPRLPAWPGAPSPACAPSARAGGLQRPNLSSAGARPGAPSAPRASACSRPLPRRRGGPGVSAGRSPEPGDAASRGRAWGAAAAARAAALAEEEEEGLPARGRGGACGRAAEPSEFAPEPAPSPARASGALRPRRARSRRPRGDVGCWWAPGSSGGGGSSRSSLGGGSLSSGR